MSQPHSARSSKYYAEIPAHGYPNAAAIPIKPWNLDVTVPRDPSVRAQPTCTGELTTGVALAGGTFHLDVATDAQDRPVDPNAGLPLDRCWGYPSDTQYHYHGPSQTCFGGKPTRESANTRSRSRHSPLVGYAIDGFGIFGPRGEGGKIVVPRLLRPAGMSTNAGTGFSSRLVGRGRGRVVVAAGVCRQFGGEVLGAHGGPVDLHERP